MVIIGVTIVMVIVIIITEFVESISHIDVSSMRCAQRLETNQQSSGASINKMHECR